MRRASFAIAAVVAAAQAALAGGGHPGGTFRWGGAFAGQDEFAVVRANACAAAPNGDLLVAGKTERAVDFDPGPGFAIDNSLVDSEDAYVVRLDAQGQRIWTRTFRGENVQEALAVATDPSGNVYVAGRFTAVTDFDPLGGVLNLAADGLDAFAAKLSPEGAILWARQITGAGNARATALAADETGVTVVGDFTGLVDLDSGPGLQAAAAAGSVENGFVWRLDADGAFQWALPLLADGLCAPAAVAVDSQGQIAVAGAIDGEAVFDTVAGTVNYASATSDSFLLRLTPEGLIDWIGFIASAVLRGVAADSQGNLIAGGRFAGTVDFDMSPQVVALQSPELAGFIAKYQGAGALQWVRPVASTGSAVVAALASDLEDGVLFAGTFSGAADFDPGPGEALRQADPASPYAARFDADGRFLYAAVFNSSSIANNAAAAIAADPQGGAFVVGELDGALDLDPADQRSETVDNLDGEPDAFLVALTGPAPPLFADINRDGAVDSIDVQLAINAALGIPIPDGLDADVNADLAVNAVDVQLVINAALGI